jgi:two-component system cell cycle sensor histidine kinase/response regulator CckA
MTDQTRTELLESDRRFRELLTNINLIAVMLDTNGDITFCNPYLLRLTGYTEDEVIRKSWFDLFIPEEERSDMLSVFFQGISNSAFPVHHENAIITRQGDRRMISWDNTVLRSANGTMIGCASVGRDVTEHLLLEERFRQAQKLESIGRLAGGVAHDFNNLLTIINGYADMLIAAEKEGAVPHAELMEIRKAGGRATELTRQLLAFSRNQTIEPTVLGVNDVILDVEKMLRRLIGENIEFQLALSPALPRIKADAGQLQQVLVNLVVNARDAMPHGGSLTVHTAGFERTSGNPDAPVDLAPGHYVLLEIRDTGIGMDPNTKAHVFEPFFTTKEIGVGTGLGLATVYGIVRQADGYIEVISELDRGSTFRIFLPVCGLVETPCGVVERSPAVLEGTELVLLVEDNEGVRTLASTVLRAHGYTVIEAANSDEALTSAEGASGLIDLLITDIILPGQNGRELAERLTQLQPGMKVLFMSGYTEEILGRHAIACTDLKFLQKPFTAEGLAMKVRQILQQPVRAQ